MPARPLRSPPRASAQFGRFLAVGLTNTVLSFLLYAQSVDLIVPEEQIRKLFESVFGPA